MSLLLLLVAVWFLYVRYQETKTFSESQAAQSASGSHSTSYTPSQEYLAELNMEKKRDYDSHLQQHDALHPSSRPLSGEAATIRLYPDTFDDDNLMEGGFATSNLRGAQHYGASSILSEETGRDTGMYMPSEVRLKLVQHGGLDRGSTFSSSPHIPSPSEYAIAQIQKQYNNPDDIADTYLQHGQLDETTKEITDRYRPIVYPTSTRTGGKSTEKHDPSQSFQNQGIPTTHHPETKALSNAFTSVYGTLDDDTSIISKAYSTTMYKTKYNVGQPAETQLADTEAKKKEEEEYLAVPTLDEQQIPKENLYIPKRAKKYKATANNVRPPTQTNKEGQTQQPPPAAPEDNANGSTDRD